MEFVGIKQEPEESFELTLSTTEESDIKSEASDDVIEIKDIKRNIEEKVEEPSTLQIAQEGQDVNTRKKYFASYTEFDLQLAIDEIASDGLSFGKASRNHGIPRSTLYARVKGKASAQHGRQQNLTPEVENKIVDWIQLYAKMGDPRTREQLLTAAGELAATAEDCTPFKNGSPSTTWINSFMERHPTVSLRTPSVLTRASAKTPADIKGFICDFRNFLVLNNLGHMVNEPSAFGNLDETAFPLNASSRSVRAKKGAKAEESNTHMFCYLADGQVLDPFLIVKRGVGDKTAISSAAEEAGMRIAITETENGWRTKESFYDYITIHFVKELDEHGITRTKEHPFFLFVDGHTSHDSYKLYDWCRDQNIFIVTLFPNGTHILKPADVGTIGPTKSVYTKHVRLWKKENKNRQLTFLDHMKILKKVIDTVMIPETIKAGFEKTGLFPFDENDAAVDRCLQEVNQQASAAFEDRITRWKLDTEQLKAQISTNHPNYSRFSQLFDTGFQMMTTCLNLVHPVSVSFQQAQPHTSPQGLRSHKRNIHRPGSYQCDFCEKMFKSKDKIRQHLQIHVKTLKQKH